MTEVYYEDLRFDEPVGIGEYTVDRAEMVEFAEQWDPQPIHTDAQHAEEEMFGDVIASGIFTLAVSHKIAVEEFYSQSATDAGVGMDDIMFKRPVFAGDTLRVVLMPLKGEEYPSRPNHCLLSLDLTVLNQVNKAVLQATILVLMRRKQPGG